MTDEDLQRFALMLVGAVVAFLAVSYMVNVADSLMHAHDKLRVLNRRLNALDIGSPQTKPPSI